MNTFERTILGGMWGVRIGMVDSDQLRWEAGLLIGDTGPLQPSDLVGGRVQAHTPDNITRLESLGFTVVGDLKDETITDLTAEERDFARGRWDSFVRSFEKNRASGNVKRCERNRESIQRLMAEEAAGKVYSLPTD